jgi:hypothetical protein
MTGIIARESLDGHNKISNSSPIATGRPGAPGRSAIYLSDVGGAGLGQDALGGGKSLLPVRDAHVSVGRDESL